MVNEIATKTRTQPPPPAVVFAVLAEPGSNTSRPWLRLLDSETAPRVLSATAETSVVWSSLWPTVPDVQIRFDLARSGGGTALRWSLLSTDPVPDDIVRSMRSRLNQLINADLRFTFGQ